jgi:cytosine/adenosine deaminase-related metal-dependent hydrolase
MIVDIMGLLRLLVSFCGIVTLAFALPTNQSNPVLLKGGTIVTFDDKTSALVPIVGDLLLNNGIIQNISSSPITPPANAEVIDAKGTIITPGFVDTHRHGWQTMYRTLAANITLPSYYWSMSEYAVSPLYWTPEDIYVSQLMGAYEAINAGVTTIVDHAHHTWSIATAEAGLSASIDSGARIWWCYTIHPVTNGSNPFSVNTNTTGWQLAQIDSMLKRGTLANGRVNVGLAYDLLQSPKETVLGVLNFAV